MSPKTCTGVHIWIRPAVFPADGRIVAAQFLAYADELPISLDFQEFGKELEGLPGKYASDNGGAVFLACVISDAEKGVIGEKEQVVGCVALRPFATANHVPTCELKRLYLAPESRGRGVAKLLMDGVIQQARELGYREMLLDTLSSMVAAQTLYRSYGFGEIPSYYQSVEGAAFYQLVL